MVQLDLRFCVQCTNHKNRHDNEKEHVAQGERESRTEQCHCKNEQVKGVLDEQLRYRVTKKNRVFKKFPQLSILTFIFLLFVFF